MKLIDLVKNNDVDQVIAIIDQYDVNETNDYGYTALHYAADNGNLEILKLLINNKALIDIQSNDGSTPLMLSVIRQHEETCKKLLENGANPNLKDEFGYTSLHRAALNNDLNIMKLLVDNGGDVNATTDNNSTIMHCVAVGVTQESEDWTLTEWLIKNNVPYDLLDDEGNSAYDTFGFTDQYYAE